MQQLQTHGSLHIFPQRRSGSSICFSRVHPHRWTWRDRRIVIVRKNIWYWSLDTPIYWVGMNSVWKQSGGDDSTHHHGEPGSSNTHCFFSMEVLISSLWSPVNVSHAWKLAVRNHRTALHGPYQWSITIPPGKKSPWKRFGIPAPVASWRHLRSHSNNPTDKVCPGRPIGTVGFWTGNITTLCLPCPDRRNPDLIPVKSPNM